jgi:hypothetical protein
MTRRSDGPRRRRTIKARLRGSARSYAGTLTLAGECQASFANDRGLTEVIPYQARAL